MATNPVGIVGYAVFASGRREGIPRLFSVFASAKTYASNQMLIWPCTKKEWDELQKVSVNREFISEQVHSELPESVSGIGNSQVPNNGEDSRRERLCFVCSQATLETGQAHFFPAEK